MTYSLFRFPNCAPRIARATMTLSVALLALQAVAVQAAEASLAVNALIA